MIGATGAPGTDEPRNSRPVLSVRGLRVELTNGAHIVDEIGFDIAPGEILCLVGESGSGKTTVSTALLAHVRAGASIVRGTVEIAGVDLLSCSREELRKLRGAAVAYIAQDPAAAFNPAVRIGTQMIAVACSHGWSRPRATAQALQVMEEVGLPATAEFLSRFPHQLSGGQLQRVGIAIALLLQPRVLIFDEPTTGLDVTTQAKFLALVRQLCTDKKIAVLYITHDLAVVAAIADRALVMLKGRAVEQTNARKLFLEPAHEYTRRLLFCAPDVSRAVDSQEQTVPPTGSGAPASPLLRVAELSTSYAGVPVLNRVSFDLHHGECLAIVGESGSGKSTLSKCIVGLHAAEQGTIVFNGETLSYRARQRPVQARRALQYIFQSPYHSLNPRRSIGESIALAYDVVVGGTRDGRRAAVEEALVKVGLSPSQADLRPGALSGGERQRVAIARALVCKPALLICDEITSALDVVVQEAILQLLNDLRRTEKLAMLFVTHNLSVVRRLAERVLVLNTGRVVEVGPTTDILRDPQHAFTQQLVGGTLSIGAIARERWNAA